MTGHRTEQEMESKNTAVNLDRKRWVVLIASCLINLCIGSIYAWSVFASPLAEKLSGIQGTMYTAAMLAIVFTVANSVGPITMISGGYVNDKLGPKWVLIVGGGLFGAGMICTGLATSLPMLIVTYGLMVGLGLGMAYGCTINNSVKFFPDKKGLVGGIATATYGLSSVIIPPIANALTQKVGITSCLVILGVAFLVIIFVCSLFIIKCPEGYVPEGYVPSKAVPGKTAGSDQNWKQMLSGPIFYVMIFMLTCGAFSGLMITSQASPMAQGMTGMSVGMAATAVSILALFNAGGRIVAGTLSDKFGRINVLRGAFLLQIVGLALLVGAGEGQTLRFIVATSCIGICFGALMGVYPGFTADQFGIRNNSVNYGIMFIGFAVAGYFGPTTCGRILAKTGSYSSAFIVSIALVIAGLLLSFVYSMVTRKSSPSEK